MCLLYPISDASVGALLSAAGLIGKAEIIDSRVVTAHSNMIYGVYFLRSWGRCCT